MIVRFLLAGSLIALVACGQTAASTPTSVGSVPGAAATGTPRAEAAPSPSPARPELQDLKGVGDLQARFNQDAGSTRLILLISPT